MPDPTSAIDAAIRPPAARSRLAAGHLDEIAYLAGLTWTVAWSALRPASWPRTTRDVLARQVLFTGVQATGFVALVAALVGVGVVLQARVWLMEVGQSSLLGPLLVAVVVRELAPLLTNVIVIVRSASAITTELGTMQVMGEVDLLESQGIDPLGYLVVPRVVGYTVSVLCLTVLFAVACFATGYLAAQLLPNPPQPLEFASLVLAALRPVDLACLLLKSLLAPLLSSVVCCHLGLSVGRAATAVPQATTRALSRSLAILFLISALVTIVAYA